MHDYSDELQADEIQTWETVVQRVGLAMGLDEDQCEAVREHRLLRMFGLLPSFAGCPNPVGTGFLNVLIYLGERKAARDLFEHGVVNDGDILSRLEPFRTIMSGGDQEVVEKGLALAALVMLKDYQEDLQEDLARGKYNPLASGAWNYQMSQGMLTDMVTRTSHARLDSVFSLSKVKYTWWNVTDL